MGNFWKGRFVKGKVKEVARDEIGRKEGDIVEYNNWMENFCLKSVFITVGLS